MVRRLIAVLATATVAVVSGCGAFSGGLQQAPLPGGADVGDDPYRVQVEFADVLDLVPQSLVKVNDVPVGSVREIEIVPSSWTALVTLEINRDVRLPANSTARVRTTSLLGEKFVELAAPTDAAPQGRLGDNARIPLARSGTATEVEEVLGALSLLLNGGGVAQLRTIAVELNAALAGNETEVNALLSDVNRLISGLDERKTEITRALDGINRLSATLSAQRAQIATALDGVGPGMRELANQRGQLVAMLRALDELSTVATDVINRSRDDTLADLRALQPTLEQLAASGEDLPNSLELFFTIPFTDDAVREGLRGDYGNLFVRADLNLGSVLTNYLDSGAPLALPGASEGAEGALPPPGPTLGPALDPLADALPGGRTNSGSNGGLGSMLAPLLGGGQS